MGQLRQRGRIWWLRFYSHGLRIEESSHSRKKGDAERLLKIREADVAKGIRVTAQTGRLTFEEGAGAVVDDYRVNGKRSLRDVECRLRLHLLPFFGQRRMASITTADVRTYTAARLEDGAKPATVNRELAILNRAFRLAEEDEMILRRPKVHMLTEDNVRTGFFERDEFEDVRDQLPTELQRIVEFLYCTGWRTGEVLPLEWGQIDRNAKTIRLEPGTTKNKAARVFPYDVLPELADVIEAQWTERQRLAKKGTICPYVFHRSGQPIRDFKSAWKTACGRAGVPGKLRHDFRRTAVRNLVRAGVPDTVAMKLTGHKTRSVFDRYNVTSEADLREAVSKLAASVGTKKGQSAGSGRVVELDNSRK